MVNALWLKEREKIITVTATGLQLIILTFIYLDLLGEGRKAREVKTPATLGEDRRTLLLWPEAEVLTSLSSALNTRMCGWDPRNSRSTEAFS